MTAVVEDTAKYSVTVADAAATDSDGPKGRATVGVEDTGHSEVTVDLKDVDTVVEKTVAAEASVFRAVERTKTASYVSNMERQT